jgi:hypothetical protein
MNKKWIIYLILTIILVCIGYSVFPNKKHEAEIAYRQDRLEEIAHTLGVSPSWESVVEYVDCKILVLGSKNPDVLAQLEILGEIYWNRDNTSDDYILSIRYTEEFIDAEIGIITTKFDVNDNLILKHRTHTLGDPREEYCP